MILFLGLDYSRKYDFHPKGYEIHQFEYLTKNKNFLFENCFWDNQNKKNIKHLQVLVSSKLERLKIHGILNSKLKWENSQKGYLF